MIQDSVKQSFFQPVLTENSTNIEGSLKVGQRVRILSVEPSCDEGDAKHYVNRIGHLESSSDPIKEDKPDMIIVSDLALLLKDYKVKPV